MYQLGLQLVFILPRTTKFNGPAVPGGGDLTGATQQALFGGALDQA